MARRDAIKDRSSEAAETLGRFQEHLAANGIDFSKSQMVFDPWLEMDAERKSSSAIRMVEQANQLLKGAYRMPFVVPEEA